MKVFCPIHGESELVYDEAWGENCRYCVQMMDWSRHVLDIAEEKGFDYATELIKRGPRISLG